MILGLKRRLVNWLLKGVELDELIVDELKLGKGTISILSDYIDLAGLTSDPALVAGRLWYRSDLGRLRYTDGSEIVTLNPGVTKSIITCGITRSTTTSSDWVVGWTWNNAPCEFGDIGSCVFSFKEEAIQSSHGTRLYDFTTDTVLAVHEYDPQNPDSGTNWFRISFTPPSPLRGYSCHIHSDGTNTYVSCIGTIEKASRLVNLFLVDLIEIEEKIVMVHEEEVREEIVRAKYPVLRLFTPLTFGCHAYSIDEMQAIVQFPSHLVEHYRKLCERLGLNYIPVTYEELKKYQKRWEYC